MATTKLKLHREFPVTQSAGQEDIPATFRFPAIPRGRGGRGQAQRVTLVAGRLEHADRAQEAAPPPLKLTSEDGTTRTPELIRQIEQTLHHMQSRVDRLRREADDAYKFPRHNDDDPRPTAA